MDHAIEHDIGDCGIMKQAMPVVQRGLTGDDRRLDLISVLDDFSEVSALFKKWFQSPIVQ